MVISTMNFAEQLISAHAGEYVKTYFYVFIMFECILLSAISQEIIRK